MQLSVLDRFTLGGGRSSGGKATGSQGSRSIKSPSQIMSATLMFRHGEFHLCHGLIKALLLGRE
jgi:hypothetical protein